MCSLQRQRIQAIETEIEGYRKSIGKAQEQNEQITLMHNKIEADISMVKKLIGVSRNKQEVLKTEYSKYTRALHETEQQLSRAETVSEMFFQFQKISILPPGERKTPTLGRNFFNILFINPDI